eukprot:10694459-Lingulodinium_polyedra.AAC.1
MNDDEPKGGLVTIRPPRTAMWVMKDMLDNGRGSGVALRVVAEGRPYPRRGPFQFRDGGPMSLLEGPGH